MHLTKDGVLPHFWILNQMKVKKNMRNASKMLYICVSGCLVWVRIFILDMYKRFRPLRRCVCECADREGAYGGVLLGVVVSVAV